MTLVLGLDVGTSGGRAVVAGPDGRVLGSAARPWCYGTGAGGFPELDTRTVWASLASAAREAAASLPRSGAIEAVAVTSQRTGIVLVDGDGTVLHAGPNADPRGLHAGIAMERAHGDLIFRTAGRLPAFLYLPARLAWFRANEPEVAARARWAFSLGDWVAFALTGVAATEKTQAAEMLCYDLRAGAWSAALCDALEVPARLLPPIATGAAGTAVERAAEEFGLRPGVPVVRAGADTPCAALAAGALSPGDIAVPAGTTMPVGQVVASPVLDAERRMWTSPHVLPGRFVLEAHCGEAGSMIDWLLDHVGAPADYAWLERAAAGTEPGAGGVSLVGAGPTNMGDYPMVRLGGLMFPVPVMALGRPREDFARAGLEGLAYAVRGAIEWLTEASGTSPGRVALCGGLSQSKAFARILASVLGRPVHRRTGEASASGLGACIVAAAAIGVHAGVVAAAARMGEEGEVVEPDAGWQGTYDGLYGSWRALRAGHEETRMRVSDLKDPS